MRLLTLDGALARVSAAVLDDERVLAVELRDGAHGIGSLAVMAQAVLRRAGVRPPTLGLIAVTVGPGGFTGLRGALALAHGIALAAGVRVVGVTVPEALAAARVGGTALWVAIDSRRGRVFLDTGSGVGAVGLDALPLPLEPVAIAGDAAAEVAARLAARGADVHLLDSALPEPIGVMRAARARMRGDSPPLPAQPLYIDPPEARLPGGVRPAPIR